jgi:hypothetical protein
MYSLYHLFGHTASSNHVKVGKIGISMLQEMPSLAVATSLLKLSSNSLPRNSCSKVSGKRVDRTCPHLQAKPGWCLQQRFKRKT